MAKTILIVDDNKDLCQAVRLILEVEGYRAFDFQKGAEALEYVQKEPAHAVLLDLDLGEGSAEGMKLLDRIKKIDPHIPIIVLTGEASVKMAVEAMKMGAFDYVTKPFDNDEVLVLVRKAVDEYEKSRQIEILRARTLSIKFPSVVGSGTAIRNVLEMTDRIAPTELTVVIHGESGSGKEVFARRIHAKSLRKDGPFVSVDCGTLQETLVESELFGYEKGAFTGADRRKLGQFEIASGGTLFLDEIGNLPLSVQAKLLRALQERKIHHLGGHKETDIDIRVIAASNVSLEEMIKAGKFREDLYHRLNQFKLDVPPLRKRTEDIPELGEFFLKNANDEMKKSVDGFSEDALKTMRNYSWPGNIREFKNAVYRAVLLAETTIEPVHLQITLTRDKYVEKSIQDSEAGRGISLKKASRHAAGILEKQLIEQTLEKCGGNKSLAAKRLKIDRKALYNKLKKFKLINK
ncbi:MAG: hypothetical protein A2901_06490 [Elusimicrobia bacterium RIFCSPLOWO2_01_FULL_54_10]|nr:MAG: hypothetical protein A2901_06490 [Elusimicrobia bacterium RIFCSPLOWO2_01_FULL_54_10]